MKSRLTALFALALLFGLGTRPAQAQLGFGVGLNFDQFNDVEFTGTARGNFENASGYHIGIFYDTGVGPLAIRPGIFYRQTNNVEFSTAGAVQAASEFNLNALEIPVDLRFKVLPLPLVAPYVLAGPVIAFPFSDDEEFDESLESMTFTAAVGAGVEVSLPVVGIRIMPELRYGFGVSGMFKEDIQVGNTTFTADDSQKMNSFQVRLNVAL